MSTLQRSCPVHGPLTTLKVLVTVTAVVSLRVAPAFPDAGSTAKHLRRSEDRLHLYQDQHRRLHKKFSESLEKLSQFCDDKGFSDAATSIRTLTSPSKTNGIEVKPLPRQVQPKLPADLPKDERDWRSQLRFLRNDYAKDLYALSRRSLRAGYPSFAYNTLREVALHNPDHRTARQLLGYKRLGDQWVTPYYARMLRSGKVWHDTFGWLPKTHVKRYTDGQRYYKRRWISTAKEAELRRSFHNAWEIRTDHYLIKTNYSLERGVELGKTLEDFHRFFHQTFASFFNTPEQMQKLFEGPLNGHGNWGPARPMKVHYYSTREEYNQRLRKKIPQIAITNGLYLTDNRTAHFFHADNPKTSADATLFHEATHQLFFESQPINRRIGEKENFWIVEGIACYMESFKRELNGFSLGDPHYIRFQAARIRYLENKYYVPLAEFASIGMMPFQSDQKNISKNYSQASGLSLFFMHYDDGRYRDALIEHLSQIYSVNTRRYPRVQSLAELTEVRFEELDRQYIEYTKKVHEAMAQNTAQGR